MPSDWIQTYTGKRAYPLSPNVSFLDIEDIAHALSNLCRFTGHTREFYSVAQHCVHVSRNVPDEDALWGLLHDAGEAYLNDISRPLKKDIAFDAYRRAEFALEEVICVKFGLTWPMPETVRVVDRKMLLTERRDLLVPLEWSTDEKASWDVSDDPFDFQIAPWTPHVSKMQFLTRYKQCLEM